MSPKIIVAVSIIISAGLIWAGLSMRGNEQMPAEKTEAVREENGVQYIRVLARGGYSPSQITAKANMPTVLEIETKGTYDCSASLTIPQLNYQKFLPATGITKVEIPKNLAMNSLDLVCSMGMYSSTVNLS